MTATPAPEAPPAGGGVAQAASKENTVSTFPRKSVEFREEMARITETAKKGGAHLRSAHAMEKRLRASVEQAVLAAGVTLQHNWMRVEDMVEELEAVEERNPEAALRRIIAAQQDADAAKLEAKGGSRQAAKAENLREHARLHRIQAEKAEKIAAYEAGVEATRPPARLTWDQARRTPAFAVALDIARQERRSQIKLDVARKVAAAGYDNLADREDADENFSTALRFARNDNNVLWGAARMLAAMVDNDDELGALQVLRDELDRQDAGQPA